MGLDEYRRRRDFARTPEPAGARKGARAHHLGGLFVVQKHAARRLHYDFRLEMDGVLKSWAVTKGPSYDPAEKRLAVRTEDHPLEYGEFEGVIPEGEYGGGTVLLWDRGEWVPVGDPEEGLRKGKLKFELKGEKLKGGWALVRLRPDKSKRENWLLIKERDEKAEAMKDVLAARPESVASGRDIDEIADARERVWHSNRDRIRVTDLKGAKPGPLPDVRPQLASLVADAPEGDQWLHEIKFDGYRAMARIEKGRARLFTRHGLDWTDRFAAVARACQDIPVNAALLDGEVVVLDAHGASSFELLQEALSAGRDGDLVYYVFDILYLDGTDLRAVPLEERKRTLRELVGDEGVVRYSDHFDGRGPEVRRRACSFALEGIVSKRRDRPYRPGRGKDWLKAKCISRQEMVVAGYTPPHGSRGGLGALLLGYHDPRGRLVYAGKVGTGFTERTIADLLGRLKPLRRDNPPLVEPPREKNVTWVEPRLVAEVEFSNWTRDGMLRHPSFKGLRLDKDPGEVVRETVFPTTAAERDIERRVAETSLSSPDKVLYVGQGITKRGLAAYYLEVADWILPHVADRLLTLVRCPDGHESECFYQRHATKGMPRAIHSQMVPEREKVGPYLYIKDIDGLLGLVQIGTLEIHTWGSHRDKPECPDILVMDLDPDPDMAWSRVVAGAREVRAFLEHLGLQSFVKTTGGKGLHVVVPVQRRHDWDEVKEFTGALSRVLAREHPDRYTANMSKAQRRGKIYVDFLRNQRTATFIAPYSTRARPGAPVAVPLAWDELDAGLRSDHFTVETIRRRLAALSRDPWAAMAGVRQSITNDMRKKLGLA